jgi:hypothetical protein
MKHVLPLAAAAILVAACAAVRAENICSDSTKIYFGNAEGEKPATVKATDCFAVIPEWQEIQRRKLKQQDADYWILLSNANARFRQAVETVAKAGGNDLVAEEGTVQVGEGKAAPPDLTKLVVEQIKKAAEDKQ